MFCLLKPIQLSVHSFVRGNTCIQMPSCGLARSSQFQMDKNKTVGVCTICVQRILEKVTKGKSCRKSQTSNMFCLLKPIQLSVHSFVRGKHLYSNAQLWTCAVQFVSNGQEHNSRCMHNLRLAYFRESNKRKKLQEIIDL